MKLNRLSAIDLCLFDGGDGAGATASTAAADAKGDTNSAVPGRTRRGKSGEYANVLFGKQPQAAAAAEAVTEAQNPAPAAGEIKSEVKVTSNTLEERRKAYRDFVNGEYKAEYAEDMQRIVNNRFKEAKTLQDTVQKQQPLIDMLMQRYNIADGDVGKLMTAIENDNAYWSEAAEKAGMDIQRFKEYQRAMRENAAWMKAAQDRQRQEAQQQQTQRWFMEAQEVAKKFEGFDLDTELNNPEFVKMLQRGTPVEHAYKVLHFDELMSDAIGVTSAITEKRVVDNVRARGIRPAENGTSAQSAFTVKDDVSKFTKKDRAEIARRVARGEKIYLP